MPRQLFFAFSLISTRRWSSDYRYKFPERNSGKSPEANSSVEKLSNVINIAASHPELNSVISMIYAKSLRCYVIASRAVALTAARL
jgi:hypothetical protein